MSLSIPGNKCFLTNTLFRMEKQLSFLTYHIDQGNQTEKYHNCPGDNKIPFGHKLLGILKFSNVGILVGNLMKLSRKKFSLSESLKQKVVKHFLETF